MSKARVITDSEMRYDFPGAAKFPCETNAVVRMFEDDTVGIICPHVDDGKLYGSLTDDKGRCVLLQTPETMTPAEAIAFLDAIEESAPAQLIARKWIPADRIF